MSIARSFALRRLFEQIRVADRSEGHAGHGEPAPPCRRRHSKSASGSPAQKAHDGRPRRNPSTPVPANALPASPQAPGSDPGFPRAIRLQPSGCGRAARPVKAVRSSAAFGVMSTGKGAVISSGQGRRRSGQPRCLHRPGTASDPCGSGNFLEERAFQKALAHIADGTALQVGRDRNHHPVRASAGSGKDAGSGAVGSFGRIVGDGS